VCNTISFSPHGRRRDHPYFVARPKTPTPPSPPPPPPGPPSTTGPSRSPPPRAFTATIMRRTSRDRLWTERARRRTGDRNDRVALCPGDDRVMRARCAARPEEMRRRNKITRKGRRRREKKKR